MLDTYNIVILFASMLLLLVGGTGLIIFMIRDMKKGTAQTRSEESPNNTGSSSQTIILNQTLQNLQNLNRFPR